MNINKIDQQIISQPISHNGIVIGELYIFDQEIQIYSRDLDNVLKADLEALRIISSCPIELKRKLGITND